MEEITQGKARVASLADEMGLTELDKEKLVRDIDAQVVTAVGLYVQQLMERRDADYDACRRLQAEIQHMQLQMPDLAVSGEVSADIQPPLRPHLLALQAMNAKTAGVHAQRTKRAANAKTRLGELQAALGDVAFELPDDLSLTSICDMEAKVDELARLRNNRLTHSRNLAAQLTSLLDQLGERGSPLVQQYLANPDADQWLAANSLGPLQAAMAELTAEKSRRFEHVRNLKDELTELYKVLEIEPSQQAVELQGAQLTTDRMEALRAERQNLQTAKAEHMAKFIDRERQKLDTLWRKMYVGDKQREEFAPFSSPEASQEVLDALQNEISRLTDMLKDEKLLHIYTLVKYLKTIQAREVMLEEMQKDPGRLNGRGKERLREQSLRTYVAKKPDIVDELVKDLGEWEKDHEPLLVNGQLYLTEVLAEAAKLPFRKGRPTAGRINKHALPAAPIKVVSRAPPGLQSRSSRAVRQGRPGAMPSAKSTPHVARRVFARPLSKPVLAVSGYQRDRAPANSHVAARSASTRAALPKIPQTQQLTPGTMPQQLASPRRPQSLHNSPRRDVSSPPHKSNIESSFEGGSPLEEWRRRQELLRLKQ